MDIESRFYKKSELAKLLAVSARTIERMDAARQIPGRVVLPTGSVRWFRCQVLAWIDKMAKEVA